MATACPECGNRYEALGQHWRYNKDHCPSLTDKQYQISVGLMMGDGSLFRNGKSPYLQVGMTSKKYLEYIDDIFGCLGTGVYLNETGKENARRKRRSGFRPNADKDNYSDTYAWRSRSLEELWNLDWYRDGQKIWPDNIELTPITLKHWYCGDGSFNNSGSNRNIKIAMSNEAKNTEKVSSLFSNSNLPAPSNYTISERSSGGVRCSAHFTAGDSKILIKYMGDPLPDFKYKWPEEY